MFFLKNLFSYEIAQQLVLVRKKKEQQVERMEFHEWREKSKEDGTRYFRANYHAGNWRFSTTLKTDPEWENIPSPSADLWLTLRDLLWRRYQRKKGSWNIIERIDVMLEKEHGIPRPMQHE